MAKHRGEYDWHRHAYLTEWYAWLNCCVLCRIRLKRLMYTFKITGAMSDEQVLSRINERRAEYGGRTLQ